MKFLKQSTAATVIVGPFPDKTSGLAVTALSSQSGRVIKNGTGGAFTPASWSHDGGGHYLCGLGTGDTDTVGRFRLTFDSGANYLPVWEDFSVLSAAVYDWFFGSVAPLLPTVAGRTLDVSTTGEAGLDWANVGSPTTTVALSGTTVGVVTTTTTATNLTNLPAVPTDWLTAVGVKADAVTKIQAGLSTYAGGDTAGTTMLLTRVPGTVQPQTGDAYALIGAAGANLTAIGDTRLANLDAAVSPIKTVTDHLATALQSDGAGGYQLTVTALANAPTGEGGGSGTADDWKQLRYRQNLDGITMVPTTTALPEVNVIQILGGTPDHVDLSEVQLGSNGLDKLSPEPPNGVADDWTFPQKMNWLAQLQLEANKTPTVRQVTKGGVPLTTQAISDDGVGNESLSPPT